MSFLTHKIWSWKGISDSSCLGVAGHRFKFLGSLHPSITQDTWVRPDSSLSSLVSDLSFFDPVS